MTHILGRQSDRSNDVRIAASSQLGLSKGGLRKFFGNAFPELRAVRVRSESRMEMLPLRLLRTPVLRQYIPFIRRYVEINSIEE